MHRSSALLLFLYLSLAGSAVASVVSDPLEGTWKGSGPGSISIRATASSHFVGTVTVSYRSGNGCLHPTGQVVWEIDKDAAGNYTGINHGFSSSSGCPDERQQATWRISANTLQVCVTGYPCATLSRATPRTPTPAKGLSRLTLREIHNLYRPNKATVTKGAIITICNPQAWNAVPFSLSGANAFNSEAAGSYRNGIPKGVRVLKPGQCMKVTARNPTNHPLLFKIYDGIHSQARAVITVLPSR